MNVHETLFEVVALDGGWWGMNTPRGLLFGRTLERLGIVAGPVEPWVREPDAYDAEELFG